MILRPVRRRAWQTHVAHEMVSVVQLGNGEDEELIWEAAHIVVCTYDVLEVCQERLSGSSKIVVLKG